MGQLQPFEEWGRYGERSQREHEFDFNEASTRKKCNLYSARKMSDLFWLSLSFLWSHAGRSSRTLSKKEMENKPSLSVYLS